MQIYKINFNKTGFALIYYPFEPFAKIKCVLVVDMDSLLEKRHKRK